MRIFPKRIIFFLLAIIFSFLQISFVNAQDEGDGDIAFQRAKRLLSLLSPEQRIGQLFLITFKGIDVSSTSEIYDLIVNHHIGGVVLKRENENFIGPDDTVLETMKLVTKIQRTAAGNLPISDNESNKVPEKEIKSTSDHPFIPLFIGISQEGDLYPFDQLINGMTPMPNEMAIGATWDITMADQVGEILGKELHALGINFFLGPSLDVLDINYSSSGDDLGTRTFGGDPFWVSQMGRAYIQGLHKGSEDQMAVIAKHFPGRGGSDRLPESEVATVRKSLEQLKLIELAPFFAVTGNARESRERADGLYLSHIRYQGLQGNIRATTKPISLDPSALEVLLKLPEIEVWRNEGGIIVSDDLGSQAMHKFFDPSGRSFDARQVVRSGFLAGNDLLYMDQIISTGFNSSYETILDLLEYFTQKFQEDRAFADRVNSSVERILALKYRIYKNFELLNTIPSQMNLSQIGISEDVSFEVARKAITLISPEKQELVNSAPKPPGLYDDIIYFTDAVEAAQCSKCASQAVFSIDEFENIVLGLYGPAAGGQISKSRVSSYSFKALNEYLNSPISRLDLESSLARADWVVFSILDYEVNRPESNVLHRLLSEKPDLIREKKIIVFAFNTPYRLDATDISSLTAFYGVYSKIPTFVEVAARVLFQELSEKGSSPVSIPGVAYDLVAATSPDPNQIIPLEIDLEKVVSSNSTPISGTSIANPEFFIGDVLPLRTGVIQDCNGHIVPDGTVVRFNFDLIGEKRISQQFEAITIAGIARTTFRIQDPGRLEIKVLSEPATNSNILLLDISLGKSVQFSAITPTINPINQELDNQSNALEKLSSVQKWSFKINSLIELISVTLLVWGIGALMVWVGNQYMTIHWGVRAGLFSVFFAMLAYLWIILGFPGSGFHNLAGSFGKTLIVEIISSVIGILFFWSWDRYHR